ncbi:isocitrate lyase/phosphoenolpyruvate mutase family protein [Thalassobaculum sp.]|uniref:isocitrate lyase/PEP mutase family protein n=1 Tax=Thalassobaculum sp. TaxID=2022740 RepID=UPI0032EFC3F1
MSASHPTLRSQLAGDELVVAPGIYDALSALIASQAGFGTLYLSGASIAYTRYGMPDIGLIGMAEVADTLTAITDRVATPVIVDGDTGFGNALNVIRTVRSFERCGAQAIQLEDQAMPKRCGHLAGKTLVPAADMVGKVKAAVDTRGNEDFLIIARTDAIAVEGYEPALERAERYLEAGADVLFIEAPRNRAQMDGIVARFGARVPLLANMVEGGHTPLHDAATLQEIGFKLAIFPGGTVRALSRLLGEYYGSLKAHGGTGPFLDRMNLFDSLNQLIETPAFLARGKAYDGSNFGDDA